MPISSYAQHFKVHSDRSDRRRGFTLVELMVAIVIVAALVAISIPIVGRMKGSARSVECISNLRQLGAALLSHASDNQGKLIPLQPSENPDTGRRPPIWTVQLARDGYLSSWNRTGPAPCGTGVWTCPECDFMSNAYGGYGVVEGAIFAYEERTAFGSNQRGSLRLTQIANLSRTWLVGDVSQRADEWNRGWYALWSQPGRWSGHGPAERHKGKANICLMDGSVVSLTRKEIQDRGLTQDVIKQ